MQWGCVAKNTLPLGGFEEVDDGACYAAVGALDDLVPGAVDFFPFFFRGGGRLGLAASGDAGPAGALPVGNLVTRVGFDVFVVGVGHDGDGGEVE